jgi:hypothetical protein
MNFGRNDSLVKPPFLWSRFRPMYRNRSRTHLFFVVTDARSLLRENASWGEASCYPHHVSTMIVDERQSKSLKLYTHLFLPSVDTNEPPF